MTTLGGNRDAQELLGVPKIQVREGDEFDANGVLNKVDQQLMRSQQWQARNENREQDQEINDLRADLEQQGQNYDDGFGM